MDLAPDVGPVTLVKIQHLEQFRVPGGLGEAGHKMLRQVPETVKIQVHGQKIDVRGHITISEAVIKFNAIEDMDVVGQADILHVQIAVAVPDAAFPDALQKQGPVPGQERPGKVSNLLEQLPGKHLPRQRLGPGKVLLVIVGDDGRLPILVDPGAGGGCRVERRQPVNDAVQVLGLQLPPIRHFIHHAILGHPHHLQGIVHGVARAAHPHPAPGRVDGQAPPDRSRDRGGG